MMDDGDLYTTTDRVLGYVVWSLFILVLAGFLYAAIRRESRWTNEGRRQKTPPRSG
ncbi:MAG TPA: hypothetical protein VF530_17835 [Planctomycetota bacterium]